MTLHTYSLSARVLGLFGGRTTIVVRSVGWPPEALLRSPAALVCWFGACGAIRCGSSRGSKCRIASWHSND